MANIGLVGCGIQEATVRRHSTQRSARPAVLLLLCLASTLCAAQTQDAGAGTATAAETCASDPNNALFRVARKCSQNLQNDANCRVYAKDGAAEYAIVKDRDVERKPANYLLIPVPCFSGVEDPQVLSPAGTELWSEAWLWSRKYPGRPASRSALAINSKHGRSQNQLHIHISCVRPGVAALLTDKAVPNYAPKVAPLAIQVNDHQYRVVKVANLCGENSPFNIARTLLAAKDGRNQGSDPAKQSIAVVGAARPDEFYVLVTSAEGDNYGHAEELLDQTCQ